MSGIGLAYGAYKRRVGRFPEIRQKNVFAEATPTQPNKGFVLLARPGLETFATQPSGGRRGIYQRANLFGSDGLIVCGTSAARLSSSGAVTTFGGIVPGSSRVRIAAGRNDAGADIARIATGSSLHLISGAAVASEDFPSAGGAGAQDVESHRNFWFAIEAGTDKVYYKIPGDASPWNALQFSSSEYKPDRSIAIRERGDQLWILDSNSCGAWYLTGTADVILPLGGLTFNFGCLARDTAISDGDQLVFVDSNHSIRVTTGGLPQIVSDEALSEQLRSADATSLRAWMYSIDQHWFYVLTSNIATWTIDLTTRLIHPWNSHGYDFWRADMGCALDGGDIVALDALGTSIWRLNPEKNYDVADEIECAFTCLAQLQEGAVSCDNFALSCAVGYGPNADAGDEPVVQMRYSDDEGRTWSNWRDRGLGRAGQSHTLVKWTGLGQIKAPRGRLFEVRCTSGTVRRFADPRINIP